MQPTLKVSYLYEHAICVSSTEIPVTVMKFLSVVVLHEVKIYLQCSLPQAQDLTNSNLGIAFLTPQLRAKNKR